MNFHQWQERALKAEASLKRTEKALDETLDALRQLFDYQNGAPLYTWEAEWTSAMEKSLKCLKKYEGKP